MKKFKSVLVFLLSLIIVFSAFPSTVFAESSESYNYCTFAFKDVYGETTTFATPVTIPHTYKSEHMQRNISNILVEIKRSNDNRNSYKADDAVSGSLVLSGGTAGRYTGFSSIRILPRYVTDDGIISGEFVSGKYNPSTSTVTFDFSVSQDCKGLDIQFYFNGISVNTPVDKTFSFTVTSCDISVQSSHEGLLNALYNYFSELFSRLSTSFDNLFDSISNLRNSILKSFDNVKTWFNDLSNNIKGFFSELGTKLTDGFKNLTNSISTFFTNLGNNLKDWFDDVGQWFTDIGDRIGEFFTSLWNKIWYGNEKGESEYQKPVINNKFNDILNTLGEYQEQLKGTISTISASADSVSAYISTGTQLVNGVINVAGAGFTALIVFGMVFVLVRKVVGR